MFSSERSHFEYISMERNSFKQPSQKSMKVIALSAKNDIGAVLHTNLTLYFTGLNDF